MATVITGVSTNGVPAGLTVPVDGDLMKAADLQAPLQGLLDGETDLNARSIRPFATVALLQATTNHVDGALAIVLANNVFYRYDATSSTTARTNLVITPTDVGGGNGRWKIATPIDVANGVPTLDANAKVLAAEIPMRLVSAPQAVLTTSALAPSSFGDIAGLLVTLTGVAVGDILIFDAWICATSTGATQNLLTDVTIVDGGTAVRQNLINQQNVNTTDSIVRTASGVYTVVNGGTVIVKVQGNATSTSILGAAAGSASPSSRIRVLQYRP